MSKERFSNSRLDSVKLDDYNQMTENGCNYVLNDPFGNEVPIEDFRRVLNFNKTSTHVKKQLKIQTKCFKNGSRENWDHDFREKMIE